MEKEFFNDKFVNAMQLLDNAIENVNWVSDWTGQTEYLITFLRDTADRIEKVCNEEFGDDWKVNEEMHFEPINDETYTKV